MKTCQQCQWGLFREGYLGKCRYVLVNTGQEFEIVKDDPACPEFENKINRSVFQYCSKEEAIIHLETGQKLEYDGTYLDGPFGRIEITKAEWDQIKDKLIIDDNPNGLY